MDEQDLSPSSKRNIFAPSALAISLMSDTQLPTPGSEKPCWSCTRGHPRMRSLRTKPAFAAHLRHHRKFRWYSKAHIDDAQTISQDHAHSPQVWHHFGPQYPPLLQSIAAHFKSFASQTGKGKTGRGWPKPRVGQHTGLRCRGRFQDSADGSRRTDHHSRTASPHRPVP